METKNAAPAATKLREPCRVCTGRVCHNPFNCKSVPQGSLAAEEFYRGLTPEKTGARCNTVNEAVALSFVTLAKATGSEP